jgi:hypothetical protein
MKILPLIPLILLFFSCKEDKTSLTKENCVSKHDKWLKDERPNLRKQYKARETYIVESTETSTYASTVIFEKYNESDYRLKTVQFNRDRLETEQKISKIEWLKVQSVFDSLNFWCAEPNFNTGTIDGPDVKIIGIKDSSTFYSIITRDNERDSILQRDKISLKKTCLSLLNMGGLSIPQRPNIYYHELNNKKLGIVIHSLNYNFSKIIEVYLDEKKIEIKDKIAQFIISQSDLGKFKLKVKEILINDVELSYEATLSQYLLDINQ